MMKRILILLIALLIIATTPVSAASVTRDLPDSPVVKGAQFQVSLSQSGFFVVGFVYEVLPVGYTYVPGSATGVLQADYDENTRKLTLEIDSEITTSTYSVTASTIDGTFMGTYSTIDGSANPVTGDVAGDSTITVGAGNGDVPTKVIAIRRNVSDSNGESTATTAGNETETDVTPELQSVETTSTEETALPSTQDGQKSTPFVSIISTLIIVGLVVFLFYRKA